MRVDEAMSILDEVDVEYVERKALSFFQLLAVGAFVHRYRHDTIGTVGEQVDRAIGDHLGLLNSLNDRGELCGVVGALASD